MPADAVLVDDGGSTRIKQLNRGAASSKLDDLLDKSKDFAKGRFTELRISCINDVGDSGPPLMNGAPTPGGVFPIAMDNNHTFKVHSGDHRVEGRIVDRSSAGGTNADCQITVSGVNNIEPVIEARHNKGKAQRRYVVSNAPSIEKIVVNAAGAAQTFDVPNNTVYTVVILT